MRLVVLTGEGTIELNYTWLPTWMGCNAHLTADIERELQHKLVGRVVSEDLLDEAHEYVLAFLCDKHKSFQGLRQYLDGIKAVSWQ